MTELAGASCRPLYKNELSNFKKETMQKIENFRAARNNWIKTDSTETVSTSTKEGLYKSDEYKGRCALLRRIRFKTTFLRVHHKTLRPLKFYTIKPKLSDTEIESLIQKSLEKLKSAPEKSKNKILSRKRAKLNENLVPGDNLQEDKSGRKRKSERRKKKFNSIVKKCFPSKKTTQKSQAPILEKKLVDSCKCESGKGLTVVIKGVCLCDKSALNKLNLGEICNEYSKSESKNAEPAESRLSHMTDSLELHKKKMNQYRLEKRTEQKEDAITQKKLPSEKHVKFKRHDENERVRSKLVVKDEKVSKQKCASTNTKSTRISLFKWNGFKECKKKTIKEEDYQKKNKINEPESHKGKNFKFEQKKSIEDLKKETETIDVNESGLMLYKNKPEEQSDMGLTKEQCQKMKEILKQKNEKENKKNL